MATNNIRLNNIIQRHFENINILSTTILNSQSIIERLQDRNSEGNNDIATLLNALDLNQTNLNRPLQRRSQNSRRTQTPRQPVQQMSFENANDENRYNNETYYFTFDTLIPANLTPTSATSQDSSAADTSFDVSFQVANVTSENAFTLLDSSNNHHNYHLYDIARFDMIQEPINELCPITRERFYPTTENLLMICECKHIFNKSALYTWFSNHNTCPCCRISVR